MRFWSLVLLYSPRSNYFFDLIKLTLGELQIWSKLLETQLCLSTPQKHEQNEPLYGHGRTYEVHVSLFWRQYVQKDLKKKLIFKLESDEGKPKGSK